MNKEAGTIYPIIVAETCWMYPKRTGLDVVIEQRDPDGQLVSAVSHVIPWNKVERAIAERSKIKTRKTPAARRGGIA